MRQTHGRRAFPHDLDATDLGVLDLTAEECEALLRAGEVGRVALTTPDGPHIVPVVYLVLGSSFVVPAAPYSLLSTYGRDSVVALEVDGDGPPGWSVTARGRAIVVDDEPTLAVAHEAWSGTGAVNARATLLQVRWASLSGRRLGRGRAPHGRLVGPFDPTTPLAGTFAPDGGPPGRVDRGSD